MKLKTTIAIATLALASLSLANCPHTATPPQKCENGRALSKKRIENGPHPNCSGTVLSHKGKPSISIPSPNGDHHR